MAGIFEHKLNEKDNITKFETIYGENLPGAGKLSKKTPLITAIIVTYNSSNNINDALTALRDSYDAGIIECIVIDNASSDNTVVYVLNNHPWVKLITSSRNLGFGRGCNLGFQYVRTPYTLLQNPDAVVEFDALRKLIEFSEKNSLAGIVAPAIIVDEENELQAAGLMITPTLILRSELGSVYPLPQPKQIIPGGPPFQTSWVCGAVMLIRSELFRKLGGFDPRFFLYFEETDFCRRARQDGAEIWAVGEAVARHLGGASAKSTGEYLVSSCIADHFYRSRFYYLVKHFGWLRAVSTETIVVTLELIRLGVKYLTRQSVPEAGIKRPFLRFPVLPD
jgi:N-acetylglucosaminyl-diphospho-decaprenol L-rhamnosyltransferase